MPDSEDRDMGLLEQHANQLAEHFDTVQIFVTRHEAGQSDGTISAVKGAGNWYARDGQVREWITKNDERTKESVRREKE